MAALSDYAELKLLDHLLGTTSFTMPTNVYVALHSADPTDAGNGAELSGSGYARQAATFDAAASAATANDAALEFTADGGDWDEATHFAIWDASTNGNMLIHGALDTARTASDGDTIVIAIGDLDVSAA